METVLLARLTATRVMLEALLLTLSPDQLQAVAKAFEEHVLLVEGSHLATTVEDAYVHALQAELAFWRNVVGSIGKRS